MKGDLLRFPGTGAAALAALLYLYLPILIVVALSFNTGPMITIWTGFSLHWYGEALSSEPVQRALTNSIVIAFAAMIAGTLAATMAALALSGTSRTSLGRLAGAAELLIGLPLVVPEIAAAVALLMGFVLVGLPLGVLGIMAAHTVVVIPFAYLPIRARLHDMDPPPTSTPRPCRPSAASPCPSSGPACSAVPCSPSSSPSATSPFPSSFPPPARPRCPSTSSA